jgi:hypothetical protein
LSQPGVTPDGNTSIGFDGADGNRILVPNTAALSAIDGSQAITVEAWINPGSADLPSRFRMFFSFPGAPASYLGITNAYGGALKVIGALRINGSQRYIAQGPALAPGTWYHTAITYDGAQLTLFVNGGIAGQLTGLSGPVSIGRAGLILGGHPTLGYSFGYSGRIDEPAIYNYALTPAQIARRYSAAMASDGEVRLPIAAIDPDGDALTFSATGLPASLSIDPSTGLISGRLRPEDAGTYYVTVTATDGRLTQSVTFSWTITAPILYAGTVQSDSPVSYWRLNDSGYTPTAADSVGTNHGALAGGIIPGVGGAMADGDTAMAFDGIDGSRISIPNSPSLAAINGSTALSLEAWINPQSAVLPSRFRMFYSFPGAPASYLGISDAYGGGIKVIAALRINGVQRYIALGPALSPGSWYHVVATYNGSRMVLYVNGTNVGELAGLSGAVTIGTAGVLLGGHPSAGYSYSFNGHVDDAAIYDYALTQAQVTRHYTLRRAAPLTSLALFSSPPAPVPAGQQVKFKAVASGGATPYEFKWFVYSSTTGWTIARNWNTSSVFDWTPATADRWAQVTVWARSAGDPTDAPERSADAPFPVFLVGQNNTARLLSQGNAKLDLLKPIKWSNVADAQGYRLQIGTTFGGAELLDTGEIQQTSYDASSVIKPLPPAYVLWDYDASDFFLGAGYAMVLDGERTDFGNMTPELCDDKSAWMLVELCHRVPLPPLSPGPHSVAVSAYNPIGESWSAQVGTALPEREVYIRLWTRHGGVWRYVDEQFNVDDIAASFIYPLARSVDVDLWRPLRWNPIPNAEGYSLWIGRSPGTKELLEIPLLTETSILLPKLPGGIMLHATLGTKLEGVWRYTRTQFVAQPAVSHLFFPLDGEGRIAQQARFMWQAIAGAEAYSLEVGTTVGGNDVASSGELTPTDSFNVTNLPPGRHLFARLGTKVKGSWYYVDSKFTTAAYPETSPLAQFLAPLDGATLDSTSYLFTWTEVPGVLGYHLHIGTTPGDDKVSMSPDYASDRHWLAENMPRGVLLYARLYTQFAIEDWDHYVDVFFTIPVIPQGSGGEPGGSE